MINEARILQLGLDASGKTSILYKLKLDVVVASIPTMGFNVETIEYKNNQLTIYDVGGQPNIRVLWQHYAEYKQGLIYVIDSYDSERFGEAIEFLQTILDNEQLVGLPIVIFFNKSDLRMNKLSAEQLGLTKYTNPYLIQQCCAITGEGLYEGIEWLTKNMKMNQVINQVTKEVESQAINVEEQTNTSNQNEVTVQQPDKRILILGDSNTGKTTILYRLKLNETITTIPTIGFNVESVTYDDYRLTLWDVGGMEKLRPLWRHYYQNTQGLIFVIDASNSDQIHIANELLQDLIHQEELKGIPLLVLSNKQDLNRCSIPQLLKIINLNNSNRQWQIQECSAITGQGLQEGMDWLRQQI